MKVLQIHQCYRQAGGEEQVVEREARLLKAAGCEVDTWLLPALSGQESGLKTLLSMLHHRQACRELASRLDSKAYDVVHLHNVFPALSPSICQPARQRGIAVVMTLHNFRPLVPAATLTGELPLRGRWRLWWRQVMTGAYQQSRLRTLALVAFILVARYRRFWSQLDAFICPSEFVRQQYLRAGFAADKLKVLPHACEPVTDRVMPVGHYALAVGRSGPEKGLHWLAQHWSDMPLPLKIVGIAPRSALPAEPEFCGYLQGDALKSLYQEAAVVVVPSLVCETFGNVVMEAFSAGKPCLVAAHGALTEWVQPDYNGAWFVPGDAADLRRQLTGLLSNPEQLAALGHNARACWQQQFSPARHAAALMALYRAVAARQAGLR
ncbi:glycosyltransferase family 4 protein [Alkalimonas sp. NCh-2]|uniref:glycosyltransferase family 4 protein n=1 Tax=Alkalimonas sp. NCh-2 TaxID=3144846 RepID=UPI0031F6A0A6